MTGREIMGADLITKWWPQITALFVLVFWISRTVSELKGKIYLFRPTRYLKKFIGRPKDFFVICTKYRPSPRHAPANNKSA